MRFAPMHALLPLQADLASRCLTTLQDQAAAPAPLAPALPSLDLAHTARLLAAAREQQLGQQGAAAGGGGRVSASLLVEDLSAG